MCILKIIYIYMSIITYYNLHIYVHQTILVWKSFFPLKKIGLCSDVARENHTMSTALPGRCSGRQG